VEVDHDVGDDLGIDLGEVPGGGRGPVGVQQREGVQGQPAAAAAAAGQDPGEVVGDGTRCGVDQAVDRDMGRGAPVEGGDGVGERADNLGTAGRLLGLERGLHPDRSFGSGPWAADRDRRDVWKVSRNVVAVAAGEPSIAGESCQPC